MTALVWQLLGALNVAGLIRAYRPQFCRMLREEFFTPSSRGAARTSHSLAPRVSTPGLVPAVRAGGSNEAAPAGRDALLGAAATTPAAQARASGSQLAGRAPTSAASPTPHPVTRQTTYAGAQR